MWFKKNRSISNTAFRQLAVKNVKKSAKEYFIYFFTLMFGVSLFYSFNSIKTQFSMLQLDDRMNFLSFASGMIMMVSVFVCIIIGFLIVYANRFLLKRRKKEIGIYITLGMEQKDIRSLLLYETILIGIASLISGIAAGVLASQGLAVITAKLTGTRMNGFFLKLSGGAVIKSILFFGIVFFFVHRFNTREIKKMKLVELIYAEKKNEPICSNSKKNILFFLLSILLILTGYVWMIGKFSNSMGGAIGGGTCLISIGTILFFRCAAEIMYGILSKKKRFYYRGLNMFVLQQLSSKMKSASASIAVICILIFLSISAMAVGLGMGKSIIKDIDKAAPYDISISQYRLESEPGETQTKQEPELSLDELEKQGLPVKELFLQVEELTVYEQEGITGKLFLEEGKSGSQELDKGSKMSIVGVDEYNRAMRLQGKKEISLAEDEFAVNCNMLEVREIYERYFNSGKHELQMNGTVLHRKKGGLYFNTYSSARFLMDRGTVILPQKYTSGLLPVQKILNGSFRGDKKKAYGLFLERWEDPDGLFQWSVKEQIHVEAASDTIVTAYIGTYLGIIFLITAGAVLALQQMSQYADNEKRYALLKKLGTKEQELYQSAAKQLSVYFGLPLGLAAIHSIVIISGIYRQITNLTATDKAGSIFLAAGLTAVIYSVYIVTSFLGSKRMLDEA